MQRLSWSNLLTFGRAKGAQKANHTADETAVVRVVLNGPPKPDASQVILQKALEHWPKALTAKFLMLPGGFLEAPLPEQFSESKGWHTSPDTTEKLIQTVAQPRLNQLLNTPIFEALSSKCRYLTIGLDLLTKNGLKQPHLELVALVDVVKKKTLAWTGKSFPTAAQQDQLLQVKDLSSHCIKLGKDRLLLLGCNDLNLFSPRVAALVGAGSPREQMVQAMKHIVERFKPTIVLQHPHATDTPNIWRMAWKHLEKHNPTINVWASAIRYFNPKGSPRKPLEKVLGLTRNDAQQVVDITVDTTPFTSQKSHYFEGLKQF